MEYYSAIKRNTFESVLMRWINLESIIQSEVSRKEKDKYCILMYMECRKMILMKVFAGKQWKHRHSVFFFFLILLTEGKLLYRILLFSVKPQHESAIGMHISSPF